MTRSASFLNLLGWGLLAAAMMVPSVVASPPEGVRSIGPSTVVMQFPEELGVMQRPAVEFKHGAHSKALEKEGCATCHTIDENGLTTTLTATLQAEGRQTLIDAYHNACMGCHKERAAAELASGPVTCGECHVKHSTGVSQRAPMAFDYSLHGRHAVAHEDKCENCHHLFDEVQQKLIYEKGKEEGCSSCHGDQNEESKLSLANAAHRSCVSCHLKRIDNRLEAGPVLCVGCHDHDTQLAIEKMAEVPRLLRGQPDEAWIVAADAKSPVVAFNHKLHEGLTTSCSTCHHQTLKPCEDCHTLLGAPEGAGVTMAEAYHMASSEHSCVGCHATRTHSRACAGCHRAFGHPPNETAYTVCHSGPQAGELPADGPPPRFDKVELAALPVLSDDFPETVMVEGLVDKYEASKLPHAKIVGKLHGIVGESELAARFHGDTETLCAGCHHHTPIGARPPPCRSCHSETADATRDKPGLKTAYHRQCVGCHIEMGLEQQGCTDCHAARGEVAS